MSSNTARWRASMLSSCESCFSINSRMRVPRAKLSALVNGGAGFVNTLIRRAPFSSASRPANSKMFADSLRLSVKTRISPSSGLLVVRGTGSARLGAVHCDMNSVPFCQLFHRVGYVFNWHVRIDPVLVIQIDAVGSEALQGFLNHFPDVLRSAVKNKTALFIVEAKFGCNSDSVADRRERLSDKLFVYVRTVKFGCIEERDAFLMGCTNHPNALILVRGGSGVAAGLHAAESHFSDFYCSQFSSFHDVCI